MSNRSLDNYEFDNYLSTKKRSRGARRELKERHAARKNSGYEGWHFGIGDKPVFTKDKHEFRKELDRRGLAMRDDVKKTLK